jgi:hypothetical protein
VHEQAEGLILILWHDLLDTMPLTFPARMKATSWSEVSAFSSTR